MPRKKKNLTQFKDYESATENCNYQVGYIRMLDLQLVCMNELSANAFRLYIMMKSYANGNVEFEFPHRIYKNLFCNETFKKARQELIDYGYIEPFLSCKQVMKANKYRFSSRWRKRNDQTIAEVLEKRRAKGDTKIKKDSMV
jgi:hypothetical protein